MKNKRFVLYSVAIVLVALVYVAVQAQQKKGTNRANFSGEWKAKQSISMGGNIVCTYNAGDRMLAKTMKIADHVNYMTIEASSSFADEPPVKGMEKLTFDGKATEIDRGQGKGKKFTVKLSPDGQTMTINSVVSLMMAVPYKINVYKPAFVNVTEVWKLSDDGKSIIVQAKANSGIIGKDRVWTTVFNKVG